MTETTKPVSFATEREDLILQEIEFMLLAQRTLEKLRDLEKIICANQKSELQDVISNGVRQITRTEFTTKEKDNV